VVLGRHFQEKPSAERKAADARVRGARSRVPFRSRAVGSNSFRRQPSHAADSRYAIHPRHPASRSREHDERTPEASIIAAGSGKKRWRRLRTSTGRRAGVKKRNDALCSGDVWQPSQARPCAETGTRAGAFSGSVGTSDGDSDPSASAQNSLQ
jgi:hypothetical protein